MNPALTFIAGCIFAATSLVTWDALFNLPKPCEVQATRIVVVGDHHTTIHKSAQVQ